MTAVRVINIREDSDGDFSASFLRLADRITSVYCADHHTYATLMTVFRNRAGISGCCDGLLDAVERALEER